MHRMELKRWPIWVSYICMPFVIYLLAQTTYFNFFGDPTYRSYVTNDYEPLPVYRRVIWGVVVFSIFAINVYIFAYWWRFIKNPYLEISDKHIVMPQVHQQYREGTGLSIKDVGFDHIALNKFEVIRVIVSNHQAPMFYRRIGFFPGIFKDPKDYTILKDIAYREGTFPHQDDDSIDLFGP